MLHGNSIFTQAKPVVSDPQCRVECVGEIEFWYVFDENSYVYIYVVGWVY